MKDKNSDLIIAIKPKDIDANKMRFTDSGTVIDELAFCANQWTSDQLWENNIDYEPSEPYDFNFEADLFNQTKTLEQLSELATKLDFHLPGQFMPEDNLQAGASMALNYPEAWSELLHDYTNAVKEQANGVVIISNKYADELEKEIADYQKQQYKEWLNGDYSNYEGVIRLIAKYFTEDRNSGDYNEKEDIYTFTIPLDEAKDDFEQYFGDDKFTQKKYREHFISQIIEAGNNRQAEDRARNEKRREERKAKEEYQAERKAQAEADRIEKLKGMTL